MGKLIDLTGQRFGRLTVIERAEDYISPKAQPQPAWLCRCDCGNIRTIVGHALRSGHTNSCGCIASEKARVLGNTSTHGLSKTRLHKLWRGMKDRCYNPKCPSYPHYGNRGITVCEEWEQDFKAFYDWAMGNGYQEGLSIDRIDNDKGYSPDNCRWTTIAIQNRNKRNLRYVTINGITKTLAEWCRHYNVSSSIVYQRIRNGWTPEEALGLVPRKK